MSIGAPVDKNAYLLLECLVNLVALEGSNDLVKEDVQLQVHVVNQFGGLDYQVH